MSQHKETTSPPPPLTSMRLQIHSAPQYPQVAFGWCSEINGVAQYEFVRLNVADLRKLQPQFAEDAELAAQPLP